MSGGRVVVGVSGSPGSLQALRAAVREARRRGGVLCPVTAWSAPGGEFLAPAPVPPTLLGEWLRAVRDRQREAFEQALGGVPDDLVVQLRLVRGAPGPVLVAVADRADDLLVVGSGGCDPSRRRIAPRLLHRPVGRYCLRHARCAVLVVPPPPLARDARRLLHSARTLTVGR